MAAFVLAILVISFLPWRWHGRLATPAGQPVHNVVYHCGAPFGVAYVRGPVDLPYPVIGAPCSQRRQYQIMGVADIAVGLVGLAVVLSWGRGRFAT